MYDLVLSKFTHSLVGKIKQLVHELFNSCHMVNTGTGFKSN